MVTGHLRAVHSTLPYVSDRLSIVQSVNLISRIFFEVVLVYEPSTPLDEWKFRPYTKNTKPRLRKLIVDSCTTLAPGFFKSARVGKDIRAMDVSCFTD
jgi:hypothetical protein